MHHPIFGQIILEITCADCADLLNKINREEISCKNIVYNGDLKLTISVSGYDYRRVHKLVDDVGGTVRVRRMAGIHLYFRSIKKHPVVLAVILSLFLITVWLPSRVLFLRVDGNIAVSSNRVLEAAETCGLRFGVSRRSVRSEGIKNALLQEIPQLQWVGVNTNGCVATISVREKSIQEVRENADNQVCSIVAIRDGIIKDCTVYGGNPLCTPGQAVKAGQVLVSGYTDCGIMIKATRADAEITALTFRDLEVHTPDATVVRGQERSKKNIFSVRLGKKVINLSKDSGNLDAGCVKIYLEKSVCLPGGFALPISLIQETIIDFDDAVQLPIVSEDNQWLEDFSLEYLKANMIAGDVISAQTERIDSDGASCLSGRFVCTEMIGQIKYEQMLLKD